MILLGVLAGWLGAQAPPDPQTLAATVDARDALRRRVLAVRIAPGLTVHQLLDQVGGFDELDKTLGTAQQLGGTRWLDGQTVQVRLLIEGAAIADTLNRVVKANPAKSPLSPEAVARDLQPWRDRTFSATGTGTASADVTRLEPPANDPTWGPVSDADRRRALMMARENAVARMLDSLRPIELVGDKTLGDALAVPEVGQPLATWLETRPIESVEFRDDLSIRLALAASSADLWHVLQPDLSRQKTVATPATQQGWDWLQKQIDARMLPAVGTGVVQTGAATAPASMVAIPQEAPRWAVQQLTAEADAHGHESKLKIARAAEAIALQELRRKIESLSLSGSTTLGQAAKQDPRVEKSLIRAVNRAHPYQVDYKADGSVTVHVTTSGADLWALLSALR
jgi:hypothetical protein